VNHRHAGHPGTWRAVAPRRSTLLALLVLSTGLAAPALAQDRDATESRLAEVEREINALQSTLERERGALGREREALRELDLALQANARNLASTQQAVATQQQEVERLEGERDAYLDQLAQRQDDLGEQVRAAWKLSRESRLKLILNQDDPARLGRILVYYDLLGEAQADRISELRSVLAELDRMQAGIDRELADLDVLESQQEGQRDVLQDQRGERVALLAVIEQSLTDGEARLEELGRNRRDLETLLERLGDALADIPADLGKGQHPSERRGAMPMPVAGRVLAAYGQPRTADLVWQGWLISAAPGDAVRSIAKGRVAYADWLRGYGLLLILDHGDGFMSLYGQNESLRVEVGDWVEAEELISTVGQGAEGSTGLYFELRRAGKAVDPAGWIRR
jgi:septal ring factor EnvC (AmiA/AmiB activator)